MRCPQSGNGCPLFVFLRRFVFFLSKRKKVFKKFKKSFEREGSPALPGGGGTAFGAGIWGAYFAKKLRLLSKFGEQAPRRGGGRGTKRDQPRHKAAPWPGPRIPGPLLKKRRRRKARRSPPGAGPCPPCGRHPLPPAGSPCKGGAGKVRPGRRRRRPPLRQAPGRAAGGPPGTGAAQARSSSTAARAACAASSV